MGKMRVSVMRSLRLGVNYLCHEPIKAKRSWRLAFATRSLSQLNPGAAQSILRITFLLTDTRSKDVLENHISAQPLSKLFLAYYTGCPTNR